MAAVGAETKAENPYVPKLAEILKVKEESPDVKTFTFRLKEGEFRFKAGQFVEVSVFGVGEAPFTLSSSPFDTEKFEVSIMRVGSVTSAIHRKKEGDVVGIRGPYGTHFPLEKCEGKDVTIVGGGIGIAPLRSLIYALIHEREKYGDIKVLYGAREPRLIVYKDLWDEFKKHVEVYLTVDFADETWKGHVGVVTTLFDVVEINPKDNMAFVCGPPIMIKFVTQKLLELGFAPENIHLSLERMMKCGIGKCGHCNIGKYYVCRDGAVFTYDMIKDIPNPF
mgnify:FL=1